MELNLEEIILIVLPMKTMDVRKIWLTLIYLLIGNLMTNRDTKAASLLLREVMEVEEVKNNDKCTRRRVKYAIPQTFKSTKQKRKRKEKGDEVMYKQRQRRSGRATRKLKSRRDAMTEAEKRNRLGATVHPSLISSEESEDESPDCFIVRPISWRADEVCSEFFKTLDKRAYDSLTPAKIRQHCKRKNGEFSTNKTIESLPQELQWAVKDDFNYYDLIMSLAVMSLQLNDRFSSCKLPCCISS